MAASDTMIASPHAGRITFVTGAAKGIGAATAMAFAEQGATVVLADIDEPELGRTHAALPGQGHKAMRLDVTDAGARFGACEFRESCDRFPPLEMAFGGLWVWS